MTKGAPRHDAAAPDPDDLVTRYTQVADRLAELLPEARAAVKDLAAAVKDARRVTASLGDEAAAACVKAGQDELARYTGHIQSEMDRAAKDLNRSIIAAQNHVIRTITPRELSLDAESGKLRVWFEGARFDDGGLTATAQEFTAHEVTRGRDMDDEEITAVLAALSAVLPGLVIDEEDAMAARLIAAEAREGGDTPEGREATVALIEALESAFDTVGPANQRRARGLAAAFRRRGREDLAAAIEQAARVNNPTEEDHS